LSSHNEHRLTIYSSRRRREIAAAAEFSRWMRDEMEELDADVQQRRETFAGYGLAMYHAQCVEKNLSILVSGVLNKEFLPSKCGRRFHNDFSR